IGVWELLSGKEVLTLTGHDSLVRDVVFTRDGRGIVGNADLAPVLWSLTPKDLPAVDGAADDLWSGLASDDGPNTYRLVWALARNPKIAADLFKQKVNPADLVFDRARFDKLVANLDSPQFRTREASERELTQAGLKVPLQFLRKALTDAKSDESRARLGRVLTQREKPDPNEWRPWRGGRGLGVGRTGETRGPAKSRGAAP